MRSNFVIERAHRIYHDALAVCDGDELVLESRVASKETMCLNMSEECTLQGPGIARALAGKIVIDITNPLAPALSLFRDIGSITNPC